MQMIAASKMRRAQEAVLAARPYAQRIRGMLGGLALAQQLGGVEMSHPLLEQRPVHRVLVVHVTPDRGLAGGMPGNMNRLTAQFILGNREPVTLLTVGKKGRDFMVRTGQAIVADFTGMPDRPRLADAEPITYLMQELYTSGRTDRVLLAYSRFVNTAVQHPVLMQVLPVEAGVGARSAVDGGYLFEPDEAQLYAALLPRYLVMQMYHALLENSASEQSARMVAMRNASDAANDVVDALTLEANKARQESITSELLDLVGGVTALAQ